MSAVEAGDVVQQTPDQFDEPLESTSSDGFAYEDGFTYSTAGTTPGPDLIETGSPDRMFNGNINSGNSYGYYIIGAGTSVFRVTPPTKMLTGLKVLATAFKFMRMIRSR